MACGGSSPNLVAVSPSRTDVSDCITAAVDGDTITIPAGTKTWASVLTITNKSITLKGAGMGTAAQCGADDSQSTYTCIKCGGNVLDWVTKATGNTPAGLTQLLDMSFIVTGGTGCGGGSWGTNSINFSGNTGKLRIGRIHLDHTTCGGIRFRNNIRGVMHDSVTWLRDDLNHTIVVMHDSWLDTGTYGDKSWNADPEWGTDQRMYFERNTYNCAVSFCYVTDDFYGARVVQRFNQWNTSWYATHGTESGGRPRGFRLVEFYNNVMDHQGISISSIFGLRGGSARVFNNTGLGANVQAFTSVSYDRRGETYSEAVAAGHAAPFPWFGCGTINITSLSKSGGLATVVTASEVNMINNGASDAGYVEIFGANESEFNGIKEVKFISGTSFSYPISAGTQTATGTIACRSPFDGNTDLTGYPCLDQPGRGKGVLYSGDGPVDGFPGVTPLSDSLQEADPIYDWSNTLRGSKADMFVIDGPPGGVGGNGNDVTVTLRDFYNENTSFNGTTQHGIGIGARGSRPGSCAVGDAWWATDQGSWNSSGAGGQGVLDICTSLNNWTNAVYTPFAYPHPLSLDAGSPAIELNVDPPAAACFG